VRDPPPDDRAEPPERDAEPPERDAEPPERDAAPPEDRDAPPEREAADDRDDPLAREAADRDDPLDRDDDARDDAARAVPDDRAVRPRPEAAAGLRRSAAGTSSVTTAFVSVGISFSRKLAIRSSWRRYSRASLTVSSSLSASASVSIAV
jgi:hypothetical protein